jgi:hypothetical protein
MNRKIYKTLILAGLIGLGQQALAVDKVDYVDLQKSGINLKEGIINVKPVNGNYGQVTTSHVPYNVEVKSGCKGKNILKSLSVSYGPESVGKTIVEYSGNYKKSVGVGHNKSIPWTEVQLSVPITKTGLDPAQMCQDYMNKKLSQGVAKHQILHSDHTITKSTKLTAVAQCGKPGKTNDHFGSDVITTNIDVICKAGSSTGLGGIKAQPVKPPVGGQNIQAISHISNVTFKAKKHHTAGKCPVDIDFDGSIAMSGPGTVKYRVLFPGSAKTNWRTMKFAQAATLNIANVSFKSQQSYPSATATLEIDGPQKQKRYAKFKVTCIAAGGPNTLQSKPKAGIEGTIIVQPPKPPTK